MHVLITLADTESAVIPDRYSPSLMALARKTGLGKSAVAAALNRLEAAGWIERDRPSTAEQLARQARTGYRLLVPGGCSRPEREAVRQADRPRAVDGQGVVRETDRPRSRRGQGLSASRTQGLSERKTHISSSPDSGFSPAIGAEAEITRGVFPGSEEGDLKRHEEFAVSAIQRAAGCVDHAIALAAWRHLEAVRGRAKTPVSDAGRYVSSLGVETVRDAVRRAGARCGHCEAISGEQCTDPSLTAGPVRARFHSQRLPTGALVPMALTS
jgi:hypothetical protein